ncbi:MULTISPECIES: DUF4296 domain-containing protein [unclassified Polaribacter]|uniref:DUF4296 domain-containing protein n=1 Tax=unclassified Polaribacter TaxID=196858 RepID=UPI001673A50B|nr:MULTISPECIES: DUF4296 domain-containing protein [unclassified Polaribacter]
MKKISYLLIFMFFFSCTSNTIFEKPEDLIPKDTMSLLVQEMMIASSAKYIKNKNLERKINYMPLVFDLFKIDSIRFQSSNLYYMTKIDDYQGIFESAKVSLEAKKTIFDAIKTTKDSLRTDSINNINKIKIPFDTITKNLKEKNLLDLKNLKPKF